MPPPPTRHRLNELVDGFEQQTILMVVDLVVDRFLTGAPKRISREAPVLILDLEEQTLVPGGGANAAANVRALGGEPLIVGCVGDDRDGELLLADLEQRGIETSWILRRAGRRTTCKTRVQAGSRFGRRQQIVRYDVEEVAELSDDERRLFAKHLGDAGRRAQIAVLSDYGSRTVVPDWARELRERGLTTLGDSRYLLDDFAGTLDAATPNQEELEQICGFIAEDAICEAASRVRECLVTSSLLVTRGSRGMLLAVEGEIAHIPVYGSDQVADVTGAGDTVIATFALAMAVGASAFEAAVLANYAGGIAVMKTGTATVGAGELREAFEDRRFLEKVQWESS